MSPDLDVSSRAAGVTSLLLDGNPDAKQRALTIPLSVHAAPGNFLMPRCMTYLQAVLSAQGTLLTCCGGLRVSTTHTHRGPPGLGTGCTRHPVHAGRVDA